MVHPKIIQGGMGVGVSDWRLAKTVSSMGALGVVSGTALDVVLARRLEQGDRDGDMHRALAAFPDQDVAARIIEEHFRSDGTDETHDFRPHPMWNADSPHGAIEELIVAANFVEVFLAKEGHSGLVGVNYLEKIAVANPAAIYGAMLAGVDYILMGAGIPVEIPGLLDRFARGEGAEVKIVVEGEARDAPFVLRFEPSSVISNPPASMKRPAFLAIVSSYVLAMTMATRATGRVDGIVVENHLAGGHNAPPRGVLSLDEKGEPIYGPKDTVDYAKMVALNVPFWIGGACSMPESLEESRASGAMGIQVGTLFAFCAESGLLPELKRRFLETVRAGTARVFTHPSASPTGYPFKFAILGETLSEGIECLRRRRVCNVGMLRELFKTPEGKIGYRCPAESEEVFAKKGGDPAQAGEKRCLCNALLANIGLGMKYANGYLERPLLTVGNHLESLHLLIERFGITYTARDVIRFLESGMARKARS